eukprot:365041-Chlamydomonas_euryale.AAC.6
MPTLRRAHAYTAMNPCRTHSTVHNWSFLCAGGGPAGGSALGRVTCCPVPAFLTPSMPCVMCGHAAAGARVHCREQAA